MLKKLLALALASGVLLAACTGNSSTSNGGGNTPIQSQAGVVIDPMSTVPVLNGTGTQGTLYIHNYTNQVVTGLDFNLSQATFTSQVKGLIAKAGLNLSGGIEDKNGFVLLNSELCTKIAANSSCAINFMTPNLSFGNQGNSLVNMNYKLNGKSVTNSQVVNYSYVDSNLSTGVNFTGNVDLSGTPGTTKYIVGYLYAGALNGGVYKNVRLTSNNPTATIGGGFINGQEVASNQVLAVEYQIAIQNNQKSYVQIVPTWGTSVSNISRSNVNGGSGSILGIIIDPAQNVANYLFGNVPILKAESAYTATISVVNNGNGDGTAITATKTGGNTNGITIDTSSCTTDKLQANANGSCQIEYKVNSYTPSSTLVEYRALKNGVSTVVGSQMVYWTNDKPVPAVSSVPTINVVELERESTSENIQFNFENIGKAPLESMVITLVVTGSAQWIQTESTCGSSTMGVGGSCYIKGNIKANSNNGIGTVYYMITGNYGGVEYSFSSIPIRYMVMAEPNVVITPATVVDVTLLANGESVLSNTYTAKNIGNDPALFTNLSLSAMTNLHKPVISESSTCNSSITLATNQSCTVIITYGPESAGVTINESGSTNILINYHGGTPDLDRSTVSESYNYSLVGNDVFVEESVVVTGFESGNGTTEPYFATALNESGQIKVKYTNPSTNYPLGNFNINTNDLPYGMKIVSNDCPTESSVASLNESASCEVVFGLDPELLKTSPQGGSTVFDFTTPKATWTTPLGFYEQDGSTMKVSYLQPTVNFSLSLNNAKFESTVLTASLVNASSGVSPFVVDISPVSRWLEKAPIALSNNCTVDGSYGVSCSLSSGANEESGLISYLMPTHLQENESAMIPLFYSSVNNGYLSPVYSFINYMNIRSWQNVGNAGFSATTAEYTSLALDESSTPYMAYQDASTSPSKLTVMKFDGQDWVLIGKKGFSASSVNYISLAINKLGTPYVAYQDSGNKATVMRFNGESWVNVGNPGFSAGTVSYTSLALNPADNSPYVAYSDAANSFETTVMKFNGESWVLVGTAGFSAGFSIYQSLAFNPSTNEPYVAYNDGLATVMRFDGNNWVNVGNTRFSAGAAWYTSLVFNPVDNIPYVAYQDQKTSDNKATVMRLNNVTWENVGSANFSAGQADYTSLAINKLGIPYVAYKDGGNSNKATVMKFSSGSWVDVGNAGFSAGSANYTNLVINKTGIPYVGYKDGANSDKATVMQYK